ncbi:transglycosylase SLT domain-containing protein [Aquabacterium sp. OR-4]|uniref:transglycosylase SLT domain-containing protein n=1 Tax=Aquabacterium sp. OR-4 TaxID=2978127 RepID=UPI0028C62BA0|nr:transglycosylase SLT domain-containing protein [Aquabacterium sp. OR-4]MDT7833996.1 transglycosylase SLT domain-containing protein [Aquabacterium sp. OR-4]
MPLPSRHRLAARLLCSAALCLLAGHAPAQVPGVDAALNAGVAALPMVAPRAPGGPVVPATVERWREEAKQLEHGGNGLDRDPARAATLYCQAARHGDAEAQFNLAWMLANDRGVQRDDVAAAHLFAAAAEQGLPQAQQMARRLGEPRGELPVCLRPPETDRALALAAPPATTRPNPAAALPSRTTAARVPLSRAAWHPLFDEAPKPIVDFVKIVAPEYQLAPQLVLAIIATESAYNANAQSPKNAMGLMQLIPDTARRFQVRNIMDPAQNIRGGMAYLRWLLAYFEGDVLLAAAAYNAGEGAVVRYRGVPPYAETRAYVRKVLGLLGDGARHPFDARITAPTPQLPLMRDAAGLPRR